MLTESACCPCPVSDERSAMKVAELGSSAGLLGMGVFQGLVLEKGREKLTITIVDHAERPREN